MTIFDSLKYHISDCPTLNELEVLPGEILYKWKKEFIAPTVELIYIVNYFNFLKIRSQYQPELIRLSALLRKMIQEYEPI